MNPKPLVRAALLACLLLLSSVGLRAQSREDGAFSIRTGAVFLDSHFKDIPFTGAGVSVEPRFGSDVYVAVGLDLLQSAVTSNAGVYFRFGYEFSPGWFRLSPYMRSGMVFNSVYRGCFSGVGVEVGARLCRKVVLYVSPEFLYNYSVFVKSHGDREYGLMGSAGLRYLF